MPTRRFERLRRAQHRERLITALRYRWWQRALFILGGLLVGAVAVGFAMLADRAQGVFSTMVKHERWLPLIVTPAAFSLCVYASTRWFRNSQGSGIPQVIAAHRVADPAYRGTLVSLRVAWGKILLTLTGLLCGASTGREGPTVQLGAAIMFAAGKFSPRRQPGLIVAGAAAGVAAAFNTPLAGIMFAIEELTRSFERRTSGLIVAAVIAAGFTSLALVGNYTYFGTAGGTLHGPVEWLSVPLCAVIGGLAGGCFNRMLTGFAGQLPGRASTWIKASPVLFAVCCGLVVALCGLVSGDSIYGTGYQQVRNALDGGAPLSAQFAPLKFIATAISSLSGIPGGIFSPSLAIGAGIGADVAQLFTSIDVGVVMLLGMVAYLAGVMQAPITAFIIVTELTNDHSMLMPLMAAALIAHGASRLVCAEGIYHTLARQFLHQRDPT